MTSTPKTILDDSLNESWVEVNSGSNEGTHSRSTPIHFLAGSIINGNMEKLLWEAQRDSSHSSMIGSRISSRRGSPKSPPNSPASEIANSETFLLGKETLGYDQQVGTDWIWDWSSRPDQRPPKEWKFKHPGRTVLSLRHSKVAKRGLFSTEVLSVLVLTNILSIILGAGLGLFWGKRFSNTMPTIPLD